MHFFHVFLFALRKKLLDSIFPSLTQLSICVAQHDLYEDLSNIIAICDMLDMAFDSVMLRSESILSCF